MKGRPYRRHAAVWGALLLLLALTAGSAYVPLGGWNSVANLAIAAVKVLLVAVFFMHLREAGGLVRLAAAVALFMLAILFSLGATDFLARKVYPAPWQTPRQLPPPTARNVAVVELGGPSAGDRLAGRIGACLCGGQGAEGRWTPYCGCRRAP